MGNLPDFEGLLPNLLGKLDPKVETEIYRAFRRVYEYISARHAEQYREFEKKLEGNKLTQEDINGLLRLFGTPVMGSETSDPLLDNIMLTFGPQNPIHFFAGPTPSFRAITLADLPAIPAAAASQLDADGTILDVNIIANGTFLKRVAATIVGVALVTGDITDFVENAQDAVGSILTDSTTIDFTYDDGANTITASVIQAALVLAQSQITGLVAALAAKVDANIAIVAATKTKITYDIKGLVTAGADATTADIADSLNKRYVTDADLIDIGNLAGTNTGDQTTSAHGDGNIVVTTGSSNPVINTVQGIKTTSSPTFEALTITKDQNAATFIFITNVNAGAAAFANLEVRNGATQSDAIRVIVMGTGFTTAGGFVQDSGVLTAGANLSGGLSIMTQANAPIRIYTNGHTNERARFTEDSNFKLGGTASRATTEGTRKISIYDGTAPVGTLANGCDIYSTAGECRIMDAGGTATLQTQHAKDAPAFLYDEEDITPPEISHETNCFSGISRYVNLTRQARLQQKLFNGEPLPANLDKRKIIHEETFAEYNLRLGLIPTDEKFLKLVTWEEDQEKHFQFREREISDWHILKNLDQKFKEPRPKEYIKLPRPKWLKK